MKKLVVLVSLVLGFMLTDCVSAEEGAMNFYVKPLPSTKQNSENNKVGYYDLILNKGEKDSLKIEVSNQSNKALEIDMSVNTAKTNSNGLVDYGKNKLLTSKNLKYKTEDYVKGPKSIELKAKESKVIKLEINSPDEDVPGIMAGGITFKENEETNKENKENESAKDRQGVAIENQYAYVIGILLRQSQKKVSPNLDVLDVTADLFNGHVAIITNIENNQAAFVNTMRVDAKVKKRAREEVIYSKTVENMQMAPNSLLRFPLELEEKNIKSGKYTLDMTIFSFLDDKGKYKDEEGRLYRYKWEFSKDFEVTKDDAYQLNKDNVDNTGTSWWIYGVLAGVLLLLLILFSIWKKMKKEDEKAE